MAGRKPDRAEPAYPVGQCQSSRVIIPRAQWHCLGIRVLRPDIDTPRQAVRTIKGA